MKRAVWNLEVKLTPPKFSLANTFPCRFYGVGCKTSTFPSRVNVHFVPLKRYCSMKILIEETQNWLHQIKNRPVVQILGTIRKHLELISYVSATNILCHANIHSLLLFMDSSYFFAFCNSCCILPWEAMRAA